MSPILFYLIAGVVLIPALAVVLSKNLFHAGLSMIVSFLGIAAVYTTLSAPFVAGMQILVYAGAIAVLLLFAFMLTHDIMKPLQATSRGQQISAGLACALLLGGMVRVLAASGWLDLQLVESPDGVTLTEIGMAYLTRYLVPFEMISILLLMTLIGAVVIARKEERDPTPVAVDAPMDSSLEQLSESSAEEADSK